MGDGYQGLRFAARASVLLPHETLVVIAPCRGDIVVVPGGRVLSVV